MNPTHLSNQRSISPMQGSSYSAMPVSPIKSQRTPLPQSNYAKQYQQPYPPHQQQQQQHNYAIQVTPPRSNHQQQMITPSTAHTQLTNTANNQLGSAPSRFNAALDQVCLLGNEMDQMRKNFEEVQVELDQWKDKCALIKVIAQTPPPGIQYSPTRTNQLHSDVHQQFQNYSGDIHKLNQIIQAVNNDLANSVDRIKQLERKVGEMNKLELDMLQAKKQAQDLDNKNRYQALELNDLKNKIDSNSQHSEDLHKIVQTIPNLKEQVQVLEQENKKLIAIIQSKDDLLDKCDNKHIQLTKMYQDNLEKTNLVSAQLREALNENEEINGEVERTHNIADSVNSMNIQNSLYLSKPQQQSVHQNSIHGGFDTNQIKQSNVLRDSNIPSKRSSTSGTQSRNLRNNQRLNNVQNTILEQQGTLEALHKIIKDQENRLQNGDNDRSNLTKDLEDSLNEIDNLKNINERERLENEEALRRAQAEFADQITGSVIPLQKENEQMHQEIQNLNREFQNLKRDLQSLEKDKAALQDQLTHERQQAFSTQQKLMNDFQEKCDALTDTTVRKDRELDQEILKNKELFDDNKLMAEEMRMLKQKTAELEVWKNKYRDLKKETKALRLSFDEYKKNFIREIQNRFAIGCDQFEQCLQYIDDRFDSTRGGQPTSFNDNNYPYQAADSQPRNSFGSSQIPPYQGQPTSGVNGRQLSPQQDRLRQMKATPSRCSTVTSVSKGIPDQRPQSSHSNIAMQLTGGQPMHATTTQPMAHSQQINNYPQQMQQQQPYQGQNPERGFTNTQVPSYGSLGNSIRQPMSFQPEQQQQGKYAKEIMQTNDELDNKLEELVVLKAKYEDALNRVHTNINNATPKKHNY